MLESFKTDKFDYKRLSLDEQKKRGILGRLVGVIADTKNATRNGRLYSSDLWENVFKDPIMKEKIDNHIVLGELGHPTDREEVDMEKVAISLAEVPKLGKDGKIYGVFDILDTANGRILKTLCDYGCNIGVSSRGTGDLYTDYDGNEAVDPDTYQCECWDAVLVPAVKEARLQYVTESLDSKRYGKTLKQKLTEELDNASSDEREIMEASLKDLIGEQFYLQSDKLDAAKELLKSSVVEKTGSVDQLVDDLLNNAQSDEVQNLVRKWVDKEDQKSVGYNILTPDEMEAQFGVRNLNDLHESKDETISELKQNVNNAALLNYFLNRATDDEIRELCKIHDINCGDLDKTIDESFSPDRYTNVIRAINDNIESDEDLDDLKEYLQDIIGYCRSIAHDYDILVEDKEYVGTDDKTKADIFKDGDVFKATYKGRDIEAKDIEHMLNGLRGLDEKLVDPSAEDLKPIEDKFAELGLEIESKGRTLFGRKHYQLRKELDHNVTRKDLAAIFDELCELGTHDMPTTCNVGVHRDGDNIISAAVDVDKKHVPDDYNDKVMAVNAKINKEEHPEWFSEELENEDGWGDTVIDTLKPIFDRADEISYEVDNCVRGSYGIRGKRLSDLIDALDELANMISEASGDLESQEYRINEDIPVEDGLQRQYIGMLSRLNSMVDNVLKYDQKYDFNTEDMPLVRKYYNDLSNKIADLCSKVAKFNDTVNNDRSIEKLEGIEEPVVDNKDDLMEQLQAALAKSAKLEKDNLSLQEKLSVSNAKEIKLNEDISKYRKATSNLGGPASKAVKLSEEIEELKDQLAKKDKLLESRSRKLTGLTTSVMKNRKKTEEFNSKIKELENQINVLTEQLSEKTTKIDEVTMIAKKYKKALNESKEKYVQAQAKAYGISEEDLRAKLNESYSMRDVDSACKELFTLKSKMGRLPFRINEGTRVNFKPSEREYITGYGDNDDVVSDTLHRLAGL